MFKEYLLKTHRDNLEEILTDCNLDKHFSLEINFLEIFDEDETLGNEILTNSEETLRTCDEIIIEAQEDLLKEPHDIPQTIKHNVHTRIFGLPNCPELHKTIFPKNDDVGSFLQVSGTVIRITAVKLLEHQRDYMCTKCKYKVKIRGQVEQNFTINAPKKCRNPEYCGGTQMIVNSVLDSYHCKDYQEVRVQEELSKLQMGSTPKPMWVILEDDLVENCKPGDRITVCGIVKRRWKTPQAKKKLEAEIVLRGNHVQVNDIESSTVIPSMMREKVNIYWKNNMRYPLHGRDLILKSFCPEIYGLYVVKLAVAVVLAGNGSSKKDKETGTRIRTEPHLLLVGDPGTAKSQILRYAAKIMPRSIFTTGVGSTSAGLTAAAIMEEGEWHLEGGALVLSDRGICCIDEFNTMKEQDRMSLHEAMEQQTLSVAKAGIVCKLNTRCSILAAANPKGYLDVNQPLDMNIALGGPLLSRFDLILIIKDQVNNEWDEKVADYILRGYKRKSKFFEASYSWSTEMLQGYFVMIKKLNPVLTKTTETILSTYYRHQRKQLSRNKARCTVRLLDSLIRLSQAHARLMCHEQVEVMDAVTAIFLMHVSTANDDDGFKFPLNVYSDFPDNSMECYKEIASSILKNLDLNDVLEEELVFLKSCEDEEFGFD